MINKVEKIQGGTKINRWHGWDYFRGLKKGQRTMHHRKPNKTDRALPFYPQLPEDFLDPKLLIRLSHARCQEWQCLPICEDSAGITIATHAKVPIEVLGDQLSCFFDKRIHWVLCPEKYLQSAIDRAFGFYPR